MRWDGVGVGDLGSWRVGWSVESVACDQGLGSSGVCGVVCMRGEWGRRLGGLWRVMHACGGWVDWDWMGLGWDGVGLDGELGCWGVIVHVYVITVFFYSTMVIA